MNGETPVLSEKSPELRVDKMQFKIINLHPAYIKDMQEKLRADIKEQLWDVFEKYV